jgi:hypothetical protein
MYRMNARVRPLLFWIRKNDVGDARITWRAKPDAGRGYELLVGSDPQRAPRHINRWGFIREEATPGEASVLGLMKQSNEESLKDAEDGLAHEGDGGFVFQAIRARLNGGTSQAGVMAYRSPIDLSYRDVDALLARIATLDGPHVAGAIPADTEPGLLFAVADMLHETATAPIAPGSRLQRPQPRRYFYYRTLYDLTVRSLDPVANAGALVDAEFEIKNTRTGKTTRFSIAYPRTGPGAEVPVTITFRPRWWFEVELVAVP